MEAAWRWHGGGMGVSCRWQGGGMDVAWRLHGGGMVVAWTWHGGGREVAWTWHGRGMDVAWRWHGGGMEAAWRWHGGGMDAARKWHGVARRWPGGLESSSPLLGNTVHGSGVETARRAARTAQRAAACAHEHYIEHPWNRHGMAATWKRLGGRQRRHGRKGGGKVGGMAWQRPGIVIAVIFIHIAQVASWPDHRAPSGPQAACAWRCPRPARQPPRPLGTAPCRALPCSSRARPPSRCDF